MEVDEAGQAWAATSKMSPEQAVLDGALVPPAGAATQPPAVAEDVSMPPAAAEVVPASPALAEADMEDPLWGLPPPPSATLGTATGYVYDERMMLHATLAEDVHPERPERIARIFELLQQHGCVARMQPLPAREATRGEIELVHTPALYDQFEELVRLPVDELREYSRQLELTSSLYLNPSSTLAARLSCGSVVDMCSAVAAGRLRNGVAIVRPPGHHAEPGAGHGFCLYNNVAVAARVLLSRPDGADDQVQRVLIVDWDVHHGNGTQHAFWDDPRVLYVSLHRYENGTFYPSGTFGNYDKIGGAHALGSCVNLPWPSGGMTDADYLHAFHRCIMPIAHEFSPDLVIISAGFDAAHDDLLGGCHVSPAGYAHMTHQLCALAQGKVVVALEGGYTLGAIARSVLAVAKTLLGDPLPPLAPGLVCSTAGAATVSQTVRALAPYWSSLAHSLDYAPAAPDEEAPPPWSLAELWGEARAARLWREQRMAPLPHEATPLRPRQVLCSSSLLAPQHDTLLVLVHDMGTMHVGMQESYVQDASDGVVRWAAARGWAVLDMATGQTVPVRTLRNAEREKTPAATPRQLADKELVAAQLVYLWDQFCALAPARHLVLLGFGTGCDAVMHLVSHRAVQERVRAVVQVLGMNAIPLVPKLHPKLKAWYGRHSLVVCPRNHPLYAWEEQLASGKRLGKVRQSVHDNPMRILADVVHEIPAIIERAQQRS